MATRSHLRAKRMMRPAAADLSRARAVLAADGVLAYPTESCFGLGCDPRRPAAIKRIFSLKRRSRSKGLILIASEIKQIAPFVLPSALQDLDSLRRFWPGPFTLLLPASRVAHPWLRGRHQQIAVRITNHPWAAGLCQAMGTALVSTSANLSGKISLKTATQCRKVFGSHALVMPGSIGFARRPSTIVDIASGKIVRA